MYMAPDVLEKNRGFSFYVQRKPSFLQMTFKTIIHKMVMNHRMKHCIMWRMFLRTYIEKFGFI